MLGWQAAIFILLTLALNPVTRVTSTLSLTDTEKPGKNLNLPATSVRLLCHLYCDPKLQRLCFPVPVSHVNGLQGTTAVLPCDVQSSSGWGDVFLILWFKDNATKPMYR